MNIFCKNRINLKFNYSELLLDPKLMVDTSDCIFISHAHTDHLPIRKRMPTKIPPCVCSPATARLFTERIGYEIPHQITWSNDDFSIEAIPGGHTFDSTVAIIKNKNTEQKIIYTGDVNIEDRGYLKGYTPQKCDILILEATWGNDVYKFPSFEEQIEAARNYIQAQLDNGYPVALLGYPLGKSQLLNHVFGDLAEIRYSNESIWKMEQIHKELGLELYDSELISRKSTNEHLDNAQPWLLFYSHSGIRDDFLHKLKRKYNLKIVGFSGWAKDYESYKYRMGADAAYTISDHADFESLLKLVKGSQPSKIFTVFGDSIALAKTLQKEGFNALPLKEGQSTLENFF